MLHNGICCPSNSPCISPVILVTKKYGGTRFVVDYLGLDNLTRMDAYPKPKPRNILDTLNGDSYFSSLVCERIFVQLASRRRPTEDSFLYPRGHFEMTRMAFGLCNSQATYQRLMNHILHEVKLSDSYVDDMLVHSPSLWLHTNGIREPL